MNKLLIQFNLILVFGLFTAGFSAQAEAQDLPTVQPTADQVQAGKTLRDLLREEIRRCPSLDCKDSRVQLRKMDANDVFALPKEARGQMRSWAGDMAHKYWPDTILEGSYYVRYNIRLEAEQLQVLMVDDKFAGYQVSYSDKAWDLDHCAPDPNAGNPPDLKTCLSGRIYDRAFVTGDFSYGFRDESVFAEYHK